MIARDTYEADVERIRTLLSDSLLNKLGRAEYNRLVAEAAASGDEIDDETDIEISVRLHPNGSAEVHADWGHSGLHVHTSLDGLLTLPDWWKPEWTEDEWDHNGWSAPVNRYRGEAA